MTKATDGVKGPATTLNDLTSDSCIIQLPDY